VVQGEPKDGFAQKDSGNRYLLADKLNCFPLSESHTFTIKSYIPGSIRHYLYCAYQ